MLSDYPLIDSNLDRLCEVGSEACLRCQVQTHGLVAS